VGWRVGRLVEDWVEAWEGLGRVGEWDLGRVRTDLELGCLLIITAVDREKERKVIADGHKSGNLRVLME
jgi:hypothetical protein